LEFSKVREAPALPKPVEKKSPEGIPKLPPPPPPVLRGADDPRPVRKESVDLNAPFYYVGGPDTVLYLVDARTLLICPDMRASKGETVLSLLGQFMRREGQGPLSSALTVAGGKHAVVAGVNVPALARLIPEELPLILQPFRPLLGAKAFTYT